MILLVSFFFWVHYFFSSITSHAAAVLPVVLAVGTSIPGLSMPTLTLLCVYSLGLMGVISPYATGPAPMYYGIGYIGEGRLLEVRPDLRRDLFCRAAADRDAVAAGDRVRAIAFSSESLPRTRSGVAASSRKDNASRIKNSKA